MNILGRKFNPVTCVAVIVTGIAIALSGSCGRGDASSPVVKLPTTASTGASALRITPGPTPTTKVVIDIDRTFHPEAGSIDVVIPKDKNDELSGDKGDTLACDPTSSLRVPLKLNGGIKNIHKTPVRAIQTGQGDDAQTTISAIGRTSVYALIVNGNEAAPVLPEGTTAVTGRLRIVLEGKDWAAPITRLALCVDRSTD